MQLLRDGAKYLSDAVVDTSDTLKDQKAKLDQYMRKKEKAGKERYPGFEEKVENQIKVLEAKLEQYLVHGEQAVRELVDYEIQSKNRAAIIKRMVEIVKAAPVPAPRERRRRRRPTSDRGADLDEEGSNDESEESENEAVSVPKLRELLEQAQHESMASFQVKSPQERYSKSNQYTTFRRVMHDVKYGDDVEMPPSRNWFRPEGPYSPEPQQNNDGDDSDDDVVIQSSTIPVKCPLTLKDLTEPMSNNHCKHVYEKTPFLDYIRQNGTVFRRRRDDEPDGSVPKQVKCMVAGCDKMIADEDCYEDPIITRKIRKALAQAKRLEEGDTEEEDFAPPGSQRRRPAEIDDDDLEVSHAAKKRLTVGRIKAERLSRGVGSLQEEDQEQTGDVESEDQDTGFT